jgi:hypothetical protein
MTAPERLDRFMARAVAAYYAGRDPFGRGGDFITAPEISQAFGECLGLWSAVTWEAMGRPDPVLLVELGPGRGTLMADALRAAADVAAPFRAALRVHLVEASPRLREAQRARLGGAVAAWHDDLAAVPSGPAIVLANEFFDALPIRQFVRRGAEWRERFVANGRFVERPTETRCLCPTTPRRARCRRCRRPGAPSPPPSAPGLPRRAARRWCWTTARRRAASATVSKRSAATTRRTRWRRPAPPTSPRTWTSPPRRRRPRGRRRRARAVAAGPVPPAPRADEPRRHARPRGADGRQGAAQAGLILSGAERLVAPETDGPAVQGALPVRSRLPPPPGFEAA